MSSAERMDLVEPLSLDQGLQRFRDHVFAGLGARPKALSSMYFYDARGSELFQEIMGLEEYYLTRTELQILERHADDMVAPFVGRACTVVDLGAGDAKKTQVLLSHLHGRVSSLAYSPIDISPSALDEAGARVRRRWPDCDVVSVTAEYTEGLRWLAAQHPESMRLVLFLGSNIGNMTDGGARGFFRSLRGSLRPGDHVLVGFDLVKDPRVIHQAYDDARGVTAAFNVNLLARINRELGGDFDLRSFRHHAAYDLHDSAMKSYLLSTRRQVVHVAGRAFPFEPWEPIHTEISRKYRTSEVSQMAKDAGFVEVRQFEDERRWFVDALWQVPGPGDLEERGAQA